MIENTQLAKILEDGLNANEFGVVFNVSADAKKPHDRQVKTPEDVLKIRKEVYALIRDVGGTFVPLPDLNNYTQTMLLELIMQRDAKDEVLTILSNYIMTNIGASSDVDDYTVTITFDSPSTGMASNTSLGDTLEYNTFVYFTFLKNGINSNQCEIYINDEKLYLIEKNIIRTRIVETDNYANDDNMRSLYEGQGFVMNLTIPYVKGGVTKQIAQSMIHGTIMIANVKYVDPNFPDGITNRMLITDINTAQVAGTGATLTFNLALAKE